MIGKGHMTDSQSSHKRTKKSGPTRTYFTVQDDYNILDKFKRKGMVKATDIIEDIALATNRDPISVRERHKKLNALSEGDKLTILNFVKNQVNDPKAWWIIFEKPPGRKIKEIINIHPSIYYFKKTEEFGKKQNPDAPEEVDKFYSNDVYDEKPESKSHYAETISKPTEMKLKDRTPISGPFAAFNSTWQAGGDALQEAYLLGKKELDPNVDLREGTPMKQFAGDLEPFGLLNQNTLEADKKAYPKYDKEKNIMLTPKTKEEVEANTLFCNEAMESLAKKHNMGVDAVLKFAMSLNSETLSYDKIDQALLKITEPPQQQPKKQVTVSKKSAKHVVSNPIR
jgi:hypothetical protein